jgi:hypothetical protein
MKAPMVRLSDDAMKRLVSGEQVTVRLLNGERLVLMVQFPDRWGKKVLSVFESIFGDKL